MSRNGRLHLSRRSLVWRPHVSPSRLSGDSSRLDRSLTNARVGATIKMRTWGPSAGRVPCSARNTRGARIASVLPDAVAETTRALLPSRIGGIAHLCTSRNCLNLPIKHFPTSPILLTICLSESIQTWTYTGGTDRRHPRAAADPEGSMFVITSRPADPKLRARMSAVSSRSYHAVPQQIGR